MVTGQAIHNKTLGVLSLEEDLIPPQLDWRALEGGKHLELQLETLKSLQASKPESGKLGIKLIFDDASRVFAFRSVQVMDNFKLALQRIIVRRKSKVETPQVEIEIDENQPMDDESLLTNLSLQQLLLKDNTSLMKLFTSAVMKEGLTPDEFWSTRIQSLRSFAIQRNQKRGPFNVLSTIKPTASSDNEVNVNVTRDKIREIFIQYPIVKKAYNDQVPKLSEGEFWSRFFSSKLFRNLRGEKVNFHDRGDVIIDKYLQYDLDYDGEEDDKEINNLLDDTGTMKIKLFHDSIHPVDRTLDLKANDDDCKLGGNKPDITMKLDQDPQLVNILRTMNRLSRRMMDSTENDKDPFDPKAPIRDLNITESKKFNELHFDQKSQINSNALPIDEKEYIIAEMQNEISKDFNLSLVYDDLKKPIHEVYKEINSIVKLNAKHSDTKLTDDSEALETLISLDALDSIKLTHATSIEFLTQFWSKFNKIQSANPHKTPNFKSLLIKLRRDYFALQNCIKRLNAQCEQFQGDQKAEVESILNGITKSLKLAMDKYEDCMVQG